ncbi:necrosis- and ethylene-inducing protein [Verticillium dahliae VdLs.17]|uniref:Necrosis-and ethylene-inducing protein n=1 Tax=Verticillium dahliae (strain VdLs.17 / ATCC MYA-4575 / FGSC 10137) TaxID=498257 RepID=G2X349_VERDV|nr:necrosis- and ethylene-inducing protein [Verticillium dahliae VdLs.17]EGY23396.1 necrosis- and ethylene-inducing protein [Verticillium dahliae VdLs.17]
MWTCRFMAPLADLVPTYGFLAPLTDGAPRRYTQLSIIAHRHDFENIVVFVDDPAVNPIPAILGGAASGHGEYKTTATPDVEGDSVKVEYFTTFLTNHELQFTATSGKTYPISDWDAMPQGARDALETTDFGSANVPFKDGNFDSNLAKAAL